MNDVAAELSNSRIIAAYRERTPGSADLAKEAGELFPSGITHDARNVDPYCVFIERAQGPHKWDVDGNRYIDYFGGHGALLLGHHHPVVTEAVRQALDEGTQFGASHPREVQWAKAIQRLVPSAERIRFTSSGTEATLMAVRLARAFTGKQTLMRFKGHFHGWHDQMASGYTNHFDGSPTPGVLPGVAEKSILLNPGDFEGVRAAFASNPDICGVIYEPTGSSFGQVPLGAEFAQELRRLCTQYGALLIFDEVVTGFRATKGGAQMAFNVHPDLSSFAKIVAGGLPGACVTGRKDLLDLLDFQVAARTGREKISHPGTFNANPVSAAAGTAALTTIAETNASDEASTIAADLRERLNAVLAEAHVPWAVYGTFSGFHLFVNPSGIPGIGPYSFDPARIPLEDMKNQPKGLINKLRLGMLVNGVDLNPRGGGLLSCTHTKDDVMNTAAALREAIRMLKQEGELPN
jgi:glutamate-1-semialdehyde 2,1-aminomutase